MTELESESYEGFSKSDDQEKYMHPLQVKFFVSNIKSGEAIGESIIIDNS